MGFLSILSVLFIAMYVIVMFTMNVILFKAKRDKEYAAKLGFRTVGDVRLVRLLAFIPIINLIGFWLFVLEEWFKDTSALHK